MAAAQRLQVSRTQTHIPWCKCLICTLRNVGSEAFQVLLSQISPLHSLHALAHRDAGMASSSQAQKLHLRC